MWPSEEGLPGVLFYEDVGFETKITGVKLVSGLKKHDC